MASDDIKKTEFSNVHPWAEYVAVAEDSYTPREFQAIVNTLDYMWSVPEEQAKIRLAAALSSTYRDQVLTEEKQVQADALDIAPEQKREYDYIQSMPKGKVYISSDIDQFVSGYSDLTAATSAMGYILLQEDIGNAIVDTQKNGHPVTLSASLSHEFHHLVDIHARSEYCVMDENIAVYELPVMAHDTIVATKYYNQNYRRDGYEAQYLPHVEHVLKHELEKATKEYNQSLQDEPHILRLPLEAVLEDVRMDTLDALKKRVQQQEYRLPVYDPDLVLAYTAQKSIQPTEAYHAQVQNKAELEAEAVQLLQNRRAMLQDAGCENPVPFPVFAPELKTLADKHRDLASYISPQDVDAAHIGQLVSAINEKAKQGCKER